METLLWQEAMDFCKKLSAQPAERKAGRTYRLPTEAQWEYACRAGTTTPFHFGNSLSATQANFNGRYPYPVRTPDKKSPPGKYLRRTAKVGSYKPNAFGLYDMHGYLWEFVADAWHENYLGGPVDGNRWGDGRNSIQRVMRGGSWRDRYELLQSTTRWAIPEHVRSDAIGFRCVKAKVRKASQR